jgi:hypothetical protein
VIIGEIYTCVVAVNGRVIAGVLEWLNRMRHNLFTVKGSYLQQRYLVRLPKSIYTTDKCWFVGDQFLKSLFALCVLL